MDYQTFAALNAPFEDAGKATKELVTGQVATGVAARAYASLLDALQQLSQGRSQEWLNFIQQIGANIQRHILQLRESGLSFEFPIPFALLDPAQTEMFIKAAANLRYVLWDNRPVLAMAALIAETAPMHQQSPIPAQIPEGLLLNSEIASYLAWKSFAPLMKEQASGLDRLEGKFEGQFNKLEERSRNALESLTQVTRDLQQLATSASEEMQANETKGAAFREGGQKVLEDVREAALEAVKYNAAGGYWSTHANNNERAFIFSTALLAVMLLLAPAIAYFKLDVVLDALRHVSDATADRLPQDPTIAQLSIVALNRLVVISVPLLLYFWAVRLVARFNTRSLSLRDDARHRSTMLSTYLQLIQEGAASSKEDRGMVLTALFKPALTDNEVAADMPDVASVVSRVIASKA